MAQNEITVADSTFPAKPSDIVVMNVTEDSITFSWLVEDAAERVYIEHSEVKAVDVQIQWVDIRARHATVEGLTPGQGKVFCFLKKIKIAVMYKDYSPCREFDL